MKNNKVSFICTTFRRFTCVKRIVYQYYQQTFENKELIIFNTDIENPINLGFHDNSIKVINNNIDMLTNLPYTNRGQICRDAVTFATGDYFMLADDDDIYLPWHIEQAVDGIQEIGKDIWKPAQSFWSHGVDHVELARNVMEASIIVKMNRIREIGFRTDITGAEGLSWYDKLKDEKQLDENNLNFVPSYCFNWSDPSHIAGHKQSGNMKDPNNFENHKKQSKDICTGLLIKENFDGIYDKYYNFLINNLNLINKKYFDKYAKKHIKIKYFKKLPVEIVETDKKYILFKNDCGVTDMTKKGGVYEQYIYDYIKKHIPNLVGKTIIDIGANFGCHTLRFADLVGSQGKVFSFEPQKIIYYQLCGNTIINGYDNITNYNIALGNKNEILKMENRDYHSLETINIGDSHLNAYTNLAYNEVEVKKLDDFKFENVAIIKIDVQGYEPDVLDGAIETITKNKPIIFIEIEEPQLNIYGYTSHDIYYRLNNLNYEVKKIIDADHLVDYVATPKQN